MNDPISRSALQAQIKRDQREGAYKTDCAFKEGFACGLEMALERIEESPSIPAKLVRHAYWEPIDGTCNHAKEFRCSGAEGCGESIHYDHYTRFCEYEFCPNCGALMDGKEDSNG